MRDAFSLASCDEALAILAQHPIDIALIELVDDDIGNLMFIKSLRQAGRSPCPDIPVVALLQSPQVTMLERACDFGIHGVLKKPLTGEQMVATIAGILAAPKLISVGRREAPRKAEARPQPEAAPAPAPPASPAPPAPAPPAPPTVTAGQTPASGEPSPQPAAGVTGEAHAAGRQGVVPRRLSTGEAAQALGRASGGGLGLEVAGPLPAKASSGGLEVLETAPPTDQKGFETVETARKAKKSSPLELAEAEPPSLGGGLEAVAPPKPMKQEKADPPGISLEEVLANHELWIASHGAEGKRAALRGADLSARDFAEAQMTSADLRGADLSSCNLAGAQLHGADLREADMVGARLSGANLAVCRLRRARLIGCAVDGANLKGADLAGADLSGSTFAEADLTGAILLGAQLAGADLAATKGLTRSQLEDVTGDAKTRLPFGLTLPSG